MGAVKKCKTNDKYEKELHVTSIASSPGHSQFFSVARMTWVGGYKAITGDKI